MKETQIAQDNIEKLKLLSDKVDWQFCKEHLKSCQRFLEVLRRIGLNLADNKSDFDLYGYLENKIKDLQGAIKVYEDGGVR